MKMELLWTILLGAGLLGGGYVTGCSMGQKMNQVTDVDTTSTQDTTVKTTVMQGQVSIILTGDGKQIETFNINLNDITNIRVAHSNFTKIVVTNGVTNRVTNR